MDIFVRRLKDADILEMRTWRYPPPDEIYNLAPITVGEALTFFKNPANGYFALADQNDQLLGFCNFGFDARVEGGNYAEDAVDVGITIRPDLIGRGKGKEYARVVFEEANRRFPGLPLRVTIAEFNQRAQKVCMKNGFSLVDSLERPTDGKKFLIFRSDTQAKEARVPNFNS